MFFQEKANIPLKSDEHMAEVQATYYSFLGDQAQLPVQLYNPDRKVKKSGGAFAPPMQDEDNHGDFGAQTGSEHMIPYLMKYVL